ncbi:unnamed protein product [Lymnaea stagnalis]|uniref:UFSP1/2/DUB catalytic domain-containing protein n=1 Tax=Lymnaea stagnalis TaxID=6523 RepID=A0AAV2IJ07_LYMST
MTAKELNAFPKERLLVNVHTILPPEPDAVMCKGQYLYYHYGCDGIDDRGWGCGYRTLQTICSWIENFNVSAPCKVKNSPVPSLHQIQTALFEMGDKPKSFLNSKEWIGTFETCLCLDFFYNISCKVIHVTKGSEVKEYLKELHSHFVITGSPLMMGGEMDNASKGIMGVSLTNQALLVVDPHYFGEALSAEELKEKGFVKWMPLEQLCPESFYNICLPKPHH